MIIHQRFDNLSLRNPVVTIGIFDGVHCGHKALLEKVVSSARQNNGESVVITFDPHPKMVVDAGIKKFSLLSSMDERLSMIEKTGIDHLVIIHFTKEFSRITARDFIHDVLSEQINTKKLILGYNHHFGYNGEGTPDTIRQYASSLGIDTEQAKEVRINDKTVSSSAIRKALMSGDIQQANELLGYSYSIDGIVHEGKKMGSKIGFPTANIIPVDPQKLIPSNGVYAVNVAIDDKDYRGMLSIGTNPTVNQTNKISIEVNIFNFNKNIYYKPVTLKLNRYIRPIIKFDGIDKLAEQLSLDKKNALL